MVILIEDWRAAAEKEKKGCRSLKALPIWKIQSFRRSCDAETPPSSLRYLDESQERGRQEIYGIRKWNNQGIVVLGKK